MEKRMILAIALSIAVLIGYQYMFPPTPPKAPPAPGAAAPSGARDNAADLATPERSASAAGKKAAAPAARPARRENPVRGIEVSTPRFTVTIATDGGGLESVLLNGYKDVTGPRGKPLEIVGSRAGRPLPFDLYLEESEPAFAARPVFASDAPGKVTVPAGGTKAILLTWESADGVRITREYVFSGDRYDFEIRAAVSNGSAGTVRVRPGLELSQAFEGELGGDSYTFQGAVVNTGKSVERYDLKTIAKGKVGKDPVRWAAADAKYFSLIVIPEKEWTLQRIDRVGENGVRLAVADSPAVLAPGDSVRFSVKSFAGPKEYNLLEATAKDLEDLVDYGWFSIVAKPLVWLLGASNRVTGNYGIDIIILTILIKILFFPLTQKQMASMKKMQELSPILAKLRERYKDDRTRLNQETMNLYKTYNINPLSGCLPMLLQIPVFIALYKGLLVAIELRHSPFFLWIHDLSAPEQLWDIHVAGYTLPIRLLPLLMGVSMFVQQQMTPAAGMDPAQQKMMLILPVIFTFMFWGFPTGLVIYWLVNNVLSIGQQVIHNRQAAAAKAA